MSSFARGRLFHENILDKVNDGRLYTKYLTGQIEADFLDEDDEPDIATSDRQRVQEDDPNATRSLLSFLRSRLTQVEKRWTEWRRKHEVEKAQGNVTGAGGVVRNLTERIQEERRDADRQSSARFRWMTKTTGSSCIATASSRSSA